MAVASDDRQWQGRTDGLPWMQRWLVALLRVVPLGVIYGVMAVVVPFYMLFNRDGYRAIYRFGRRCFGFSPLQAFFYVYANHFRFGQVVIDRFAAYAGRRFKFSFVGLERFSQLEAADGGFVQVSAHVGCYEMAGYSLVSRRKRMHTVVFAGESETIRTHRERLLSPHNMALIPVRSDMSHLFLINAALDKGEIVGMTADRCNGSSKSVVCRFFHQPVLLPMGPFMVAAKKQVPVLAAFVMKQSSHRYHCVVRRLVCDPSLPVRTQVEALAQAFATDLEEVVRRYPCQWFNYFDFFNIHNK